MRGLGFGVVALATLAGACSAGGPTPDASIVEAGSEAGSEAGAPEAGAPEAGAVDAGAVDAGASTLTATFGANTRGFDRAQFGLEPGVALPGRGVHIEMYAGGDPACPTMTSRTPDRTLVLSGVRVPAAHAPLTEADGLSLSLLDFQGDLSMSPMPSRATAVRVTVLEATLEPSDSARLVLDVEGDFAGGATVRGRVTATHCNSLD